MKYRIALSVLVSFLIMSSCLAQFKLMDAVPVEVKFDRPVRDWDGFGFNYVETAQTINFDTDPQEYGGFSLLSQEDQEKVLDMVFGENGLKPGLVKMFLDPFHQEKPGGPFNHTKTQSYMINFVKNGLAITRQWGGDLSIISTLYGPPEWATQQKFMRGRDLDPDHTEDLAVYIADWANFLKTEAELPIKYVSIHNEGEDWHRWPDDGTSGNIGGGHDYNLYWTPEAIAGFLPVLRNALDSYGLQDVGTTPGETTNWFRFYYWGYADALADDPDALASLGLITSHGFYSGKYGRWFGEHNSLGNDVIRAKRPEMHSWVTSTSWSKMDADFIKEMQGNIYTSKVNGIIPWAGIQRPSKWVGGDPNPGCAFRVSEDGTLEVMPGYYFYKQISRAGQPGMAVAQAHSQSSRYLTIAFASNGTENPDAFLIINLSDMPIKGAIQVSGSKFREFDAYRTDPDIDRYTGIGSFSLNSRNEIIYEAPPGSVTTFFGM
jgi:hypothetical protein